MVATDVASRGIGMIDRRSAPPPAFPISSIDVVWLCFYKDLLSADGVLQLLLSGPGSS